MQLRSFREIFVRVCEIYSSSHHSYYELLATSISMSVETVPRESRNNVVCDQKGSAYEASF